MMKTEAPSAEPSLSTWLFGMFHVAKRYAWPLFWFSLAVNILLLVSPIYMLQIYDRVLLSGSLDTLGWLTLIALFLLCIYAAAEAGRRRVAALAAHYFDRVATKRLFQDFAQNPRAAGGLAQRLGDLARVQQTLQTGTILAFFDLGFSPFFLALMFLIHPLIGAVGLVGAAILVGLAVLAEMVTRRSGAKTALDQNAAQELALSISRQRSAIVAMGLIDRVYARWRRTRDAAEAAALATHSADGGFSSLSRAFRLILQMAILGLGAALVIGQEMSAGAIIAASIISARALGPIDQIVGAWRGIELSRRAWGGLASAFGAADAAESATPVPTPAAKITIDRLEIAAPGAREPLLRPFGLEITGPRALAVVGANGAGKTSLLQTLIGVWPPQSGSVRFDGLDMHAWDGADRGLYVGYLPQAVELLPGSVIDNIARFHEGREPDAFAAAKMVGAHEMIVSLPKGYDTLIGPGGVALSAGQRQMIGLARAFFGRPLFLALDEPTANLDRDATGLVINAILAHAAQGGISIIATHDPRVIANTHGVLTIRKGALVALSPAEYFAEEKAQPPAATAAPTARRIVARASDNGASGA